MTATHLLAALLVLLNANTLACPVQPHAVIINGVSEPFVDDMATLNFGWKLRCISDVHNSCVNVFNITQLEFKLELSSSLSFSSLIWETGVVPSAVSRILYSGPRLESSSSYFLRVTTTAQYNNQTKCVASTIANFHTALVLAGSGDVWESAKWLQRDHFQPQTDCEFYDAHPVPLFRRDFNLPDIPASARLYVVGLGYATVYVNAEQLRPDTFLDTPWSEFNKTIYYSALHVPPSLFRSGHNVIGVEVGNGYWNPLPLRMWGSLDLRNTLAIGQPTLKLRLEIYLHDGSLAVVDTSTIDNWRVGKGSIIRNNVYLGEHYDARREVHNWSSPSFQLPASWTQPVIATAAEEPKGALRLVQIPQVKSQEIVRPVDTWIQRNPDGPVFMVDFGINFSGVINFTLPARSCASGDKIRFRYGEVTYPNRTINVMTSVAGQVKVGNGGPCAPYVAYQGDIYVCSLHAGNGAASFSYRPKYTWHAFRFLEVSVPSYLLPKLLPSNFFGIRLQNDVRQHSVWNSSNALLNSIHKMTVNSYRNNFIGGVQTDCPHRERFGYGGDVHASAEAALLNFDVINFYQKRMVDFSDAQRSNGT